jgi:Ca-activated chloride channel homolog
MRYAVITNSSPVRLPGLISILLALTTLAFTAHVPSSRANTFQTDEGLRFELPANGNLRVENRRGGVIVSVWSENYVSVSAETDAGNANQVKPIIDRTEALLSIRLARGAAANQPMNLRLQIPERAHASIVTGEGSVEMQGIPAALLIQTISGEIRVEVPPHAGASFIADSKTGNVSSSFQDLANDRGRSPQLSGKLGNGNRNVRLYSQAGNITLAAGGRETARVFSTTPPRRAALSQPVATPTPGKRPELIGPDPSRPTAGTPATPNAGPEEVDEGDVLRVDTELVSVNVSVIDRGTNHGVNDLTKDDFRLFEDNVPQQIAHFDSASAPFNLVLLIDLSGSTTKVVELIKAAAIHFVEAARPFDRIGVITFAGDQVLVSSLTTDHQALRQRIGAIQKPEGSTKLYDSAIFAMDEIFREAKDSRRNAIVVISDGLDSVLPNVTGDGSTHTYDEMIRHAKEFDGVIYSIWTDTQSYEPLSPQDIQQETFDLAHDHMQELADVGGGAFYECEELKDLAGAYDRVVADLGTVYTLSYRPTNKVRDGSWRTIRVNVNRRNTVARGKRGYFAR